MDSPLALTSTVTVSDAVVAADIQDEVVLLHPDDQMYYALNPMGRRVWALLQHPIEVGEIVETVADEHDVDRRDCERDILRFLAKLYETDLIHLTEGRSDSETRPL